MLATLETYLPPEFLQTPLPGSEPFAACLGCKLPDWVIALGIASTYDLNLMYPSGLPQRVRRLLISYGSELIDLAVRVACFESLRPADAELISKTSQQKNAVAAAWARAIQLKEMTRSGLGRTLSEPEWKPLEGVAVLAGGVVLVNGFAGLLECLRDFVHLEIRQASTADTKTNLQEISQARFKELPRYEVLSESGPAHSKNFEVSVTVGPYRCTSRGPSKKRAEQEAARALLSKLGNPQESSASARVRLPRSTGHRVPNVQQESLLLAQGALHYSFRDSTLLSAALIHSSYVSESGAQETLLDYRPLAAIGSTLSTVLVLRNFCERPELHAHSDLLARAISHCVNKETLAKSSLALRLSEWVLVGKGQGRSRLSTRLISDILQAALAAVFIDGGKSLDVESLRFIDPYFYREIYRAVGCQVPTIDAKTKLQEIFQTFGEPPVYSFEQAGPQHQLSFESRVQIVLAGKSFSFVGRGSSKRYSDNDAARQCLEILDIARGCLSKAVIMRLSPDEYEVVRLFLGETITRFAHGEITWKRFGKLDIQIVTSIVFGDRGSLGSSLFELWRACREFSIELSADQWLRIFKACPKKKSLSFLGAADLLRSLHSFSVSLDPGGDGPLPTQINLFHNLRLLTAVLGTLSESRSALISTEEVLEALMLMRRRRHAGLIVSNCCQGIYLVDASLLEVVSVVLGDLDPPGAARSLRTELSCDAGRVEFRIYTSQETFDLTPLDANWLQSSFAELSVDIVIKKGDGFYGFYSTAIACSGGSAWDTWVKVALEELLAMHDRDRNMARRSGQLLHDLKNLMIAISAQMASGRSAHALRYQSFANAETLLVQTLSHLSLALQWVEQPTHVELVLLNLRQVMQAIVAGFLATVPASVALTTHLDSEDVLVAGDEKLLAALFLNILKNATEAMPAGGHLSFEWIYIAESDSVMVEISDSGRGFPSSVLDALERGELPESSKRTGQGLGLASVQHLVDLHGGTLSLRNSTRGAIVTVMLPAESKAEQIQEVEKLK